MDENKTINLGNLLLSLSDSIDLASPEIAKHQQRTAYIALELCNAASLSKEQTKNIFIASLLHDTGVITSEEKKALHNFENLDTDNHCSRGEILLKRVPEFEKVAPLVKNHHKEWNKWNKSIDEEEVISSQIIFLADYIERLIDRNIYILQQTETIIGRIKLISDSIIHPRVVNYFLDISRKESFWLNITYPRLFSLLYQTGPLKNIVIDYTSLEAISKFFRDLIDFKSPFTATHTVGVAGAAEMISKLYNQSEEEILEIKIAGNFHDLGKMVIPNSILNKPGKLTEEEFNIIKSHTFYTYHIINSIAGLDKIAQWASFHHEKLDGSGYPFNNKEEDISTGARIIAVSDIFTAISEDRPYRKGMNKDLIKKIMNEMKAKKHIDSQITELLFDNYDDIHDYVKIKQELAQEFYNTRFAKEVDYTDLDN